MSRYFDLVCLSRWSGVVWSVVAGALIFVWAKSLFGAWAGCLSLALWCFDPNVIAHAALATTDIPAAAMALVACLIFRNYLRQASWSRAWFAGIVLGAAQLTKFTLLALYPIWFLTAVLFWWGRFRERAARRWLQGSMIFGLSVLVVNVGYTFEGSFRPLGEYRFVSKAFRGHEDPSSRQAGGAPWDDFPVPLPANFVLGLDSQRRDFESGWPVYLGGEWREGGWWYFYPYAAAVKLPVGTLVLLLGSFVWLWLPSMRTHWREELAILMPAVGLLALVISQETIQYLRYLIPAFPFLLISAGRWLLLPGNSRMRASVLCVAVTLVLWNAYSCLRIHPHYLSYFNELAGGPEHGAEHLVDSNLDWGQDLLHLKNWLDEHPQARPLRLAYFGFFDPVLLGLQFELPPLECVVPRSGVTPTLEPGYYAISTHFLRGGSFVLPDGKGSWRTVPLHGYEYFQRLEPIARAGWSITVFRVRPRRPQEGAERAPRSDR